MTTKSKPIKPKDRQTKKEEVEDINELTAAEKKLINLICRIKGEKVYDDITEDHDVEVNVEDAE